MQKQLDSLAIDGTFPDADECTTGRVVHGQAADDPLLRSGRVLITPHVASLTAATYREMCVATARSVVAVLNGTAPRNARA